MEKQGAGEQHEEGSKQLSKMVVTNVTKTLERGAQRASRGEMPVSISCGQERGSRCILGVKVDEKHKCWEAAGGQHIREPWPH